MSIPETSPLTQRGTLTPPPASAGRDADVSVLGMVNVLLHHRTLIIAMSLLLAVPTAVFTLTRPRTYSSISSFMPQSKRPASAAAGLAAQFGLTMPGSEPGQSPAFYAELVRSAEILGPVVDHQYETRTARGPATQTLVELYGAEDLISGPTPALRRDAAIERLKRSLGVSVTKTGLVRVTVTAQDPSLAQQINAHILTRLNQFNLENQRGQAAAERRFVERRLEEVRRDLRDAEDRLQLFLQRNRAYSQSPELTFQQERLAREVSLQQQLHTTLAQSYEQAKIEEVRDTPVITTVERPNFALRPNRRGTVTRTLTALVVGALFGVVLAFFRAFTRGAKPERTTELDEFSMLREAAMDDLRHPWRPVLRMLGRPARSSHRRPEAVQ